MTTTMNSQSVRAITSTSKWRQRRFPALAMIRLAAGSRTWIGGWRASSSMRLKMILTHQRGWKCQRWGH